MSSLKTMFPLMVMMAMGGLNGSTQQPKSTRRVEDLATHEPSKQGQKNWVVNGVHIQAATRNQAIKKARKEYGEGFDNRPLVCCQI
jgi:hypothetical protein